MKVKNFLNVMKNIDGIIDLTKKELMKDAELSKLDDGLCLLYILTELECAQLHISNLICMESEE